MEWKRFRNSHYWVSPCGKIKSKATKGPRSRGYHSTRIDRYGYEITTIYLEAKSKTVKVHRMVAECYLPNPDNKPQVNHLDGSKLNNNVDNLAWVTGKENAQHAVEKGLWDLTKQTEALNKYTSSPEGKAHAKWLGDTYKHQTLKQYQKRGED